MQLLQPRLREVKGRVAMDQRSEGDRGTEGKLSLGGVPIDSEGHTVVSVRGLKKSEINFCRYAVMFWKCLELLMDPSCSFCKKEAGTGGGCPLRCLERHRHEKNRALARLSPFLYLSTQAQLRAAATAWKHLVKVRHTACYLSFVNVVRAGHNSCGREGARACD